MARAREPIRPRLMRKIEMQGHCWVWQGCTSRDGYGVLTIGRKQYRAHRTSYQSFVGDIPPGYLVCHTCDNPLCINPQHLFIGKPKDNTQDMLSKGRRPVIAGLDHPNTKIPPSERATIRVLRSNGETLKSIAQRYGVSFQCISQICKRKRNYETKV